MAFFGGGAVIPVKSVIRTEWNQESGQQFPNNSQVSCLWSESETFNTGDLFVYHADYNEQGYTAIEVTRDCKIIINCSMGSQGGAWAGATLATNLFNSVAGGVIDVFYELPIPDDGSLYPTASSLIRSANSGDIFFTSFKLAGDDFDAYDINTLSAWAIAEL